MQKEEEKIIDQVLSELARIRFVCKMCRHVISVPKIGYQILNSKLKQSITKKFNLEIFMMTFEHNSTI